MRLLIEIIVLYLLFKFVFNFIIPLFKVGIAVKKNRDQFKKERQQQDAVKQTQATEKKQHKNKEPIGDYIDYEDMTTKK